MTRKIIAMTTLAAFFNTLFAGCAQYTTMSLSDFLDSRHKQISEATTNDGDRIVFDSAGAQYLSNRKAILGVTENGSQAYSFIRDLDKITLVDPTHGDSLPLIVPAPEYPSHPSLKRYHRISSVVTNQGERFRFKSTGATIDFPNQTFVGAVQTSLSGEKYLVAQLGDTSFKPHYAVDGSGIPSFELAVPFDSVDQVEVLRYRRPWFLPGVLGTVAGLILIGAIFYSSGGPGLPD